MMKRFFSLGIITARAGSKGVKNKNIRLLAGKPLILYTLNAVNKSALLDDCIVTTDSPKIRNICIKHRVKAPFLRPRKLAGDIVSSAEVVKHAVMFYEKWHNCKIDYIVLLQPTSPLRTPIDIDTAIRLAVKNPKAKSLISCYDAADVHPRIMYTRRNLLMKPFLKRRNTAMRRQDFERVYVRNGAIYITRRDLLFEKGVLFDDMPLGYVMPRERSVNIDQEVDLLFAQSIIKCAK